MWYRLNQARGPRIEFLLQRVESQSGDWSEDEGGSSFGEPPQDLESALQRIKLLEIRLAKANQNLVDYREFVVKQLDIEKLTESVPTTSKVDPITAERDDDSHYFTSYGSNGTGAFTMFCLNWLIRRKTDIHATMLTDKVRTSTYASFILGMPTVFNEAVVLDVGCGTGILSMFAARSGAKRVYAVDASNIVKRAKKIIEDNGHDDVITFVSHASYKPQSIALLEGPWRLTRYSIYIWTG